MKIRIHLKIKIKMKIQVENLKRLFSGNYYLAVFEVETACVHVYKLSVVGPLFFSFSSLSSSLLL